MFPTEQQQSGKLPQELYRLLDPQASVDLPSAHLISSRQLDNRELDKLFAALGRNKVTWRRALVLHEWLLSMGHTPDDRLCTTLIRVCSQHGQTMTALSLYDWMRSSQRTGGAGLVPTVYTYTAAMRAALTGNMIDRAVKVPAYLLLLPYGTGHKLANNLITKYLHHAQLHANSRLIAWECHVHACVLLMWLLLPTLPVLLQCC